MTKNLTEGRELPLLLRFMLPVMLGILLQQFYNLTDTVIVGKFLGKEAMAATGSVGSVTFLIIGFTSGLSSGFSIPVSQRFGAGDETDMRRFVGNAMTIGALVGVVFAVVSVILCRSILTWMHTPADMMEHAYAYLVVLLGAIPLTLFYNLFAGCIRAVGDSRTPVLILAVSGLLNVALTAVLVIFTPMGTAGAAIATAASNLLSCILAVRHIVCNIPCLHISREERTFSRRHCAVLCLNGIPMGLQFSITAVGSVILQTAVNGLGSDAVAATTAANKLYSLFAQSFYDAQGATMATWCGQHTGAGKIRRIATGARHSLLLGIAYNVLCMSVFCLLGTPLVRLFLEASEVQAIADACLMLRIVGASYFLLSILSILRNSVQGMGFGRLAMLAGVLELIARVVTAWLLVPAFGFLGSCFASPLAWLLADLFLLFAFLHCYKVLRQQITEEKFTV